MANIQNIMNTYTSNMGNMTLPAISIRDLSLITGMNANFDVSRSESLVALEESVKEDSLIYLIAQIDADKEEISLENLREVGVLAKITNLIRLPYNAIKVSVKILNRVKIKEYIQASPYILANADIINYSEEELTEEEIAMTNILKEKFNKYSAYKMSTAEFELSSFLSSIKNPNELIDLILPPLNLDYDTFQDILCMTDTKQRYKEVYKVLEKRISVLSLENEIEKEVKEKMEKLQKEVYLREKIEVLQDRLHNADGSASGSDYTKKLEKLPIPEEYKEKIQKEIDRLNTIPVGSSEAGVIQTYIETILDLPWGKEEKTDIDLKEAQKTLDEDHYGLKEVKERIIEYLSVLKLTNSLKGPIVCLVGPPGVGKTSIAKAIAKASKRKFVRLSVGGTRDEAEITGHRRTYIGAMPGRIIAGIKQAKTNSPLFLLDEIDKIGSDFKGDPASALLEVLDPEQNSNFSDHYLEIPFDLSNVLFVATANTAATIPPALLDRMEVIEIPGYMPKEKVEIAKKHLIKKELEAHGLTKDNLKFTPAALDKIVSDYTLESGVRQLERLIAKICRKCAKKIVLNEDEKIEVTVKNLHEYLGKELITFNKQSNKKYVGKVTGLAYTSYGGDTLKIEAVLTEGKGRIELTGNLGDVMQESAKTALTYVRTIADKLNADKDFYEKKDIHIHVPEGATPKDGPSAGITLATAIISALTNMKVAEDIAMTGEITLSGDVLPIGGLREKLLAAARARVKKVLIPKENVKDLEEISEDIKKHLEIIPVKHMKEVYKIIFEEEK
ncbi:endopeptidase La [Anaerofustis butyriciformans]|uniref:endopeptidase La n=1 Tax=Anaerofustis butyriciformans TaxID=3108533 RepID=UPI003F8CA448